MISKNRIFLNWLFTVIAGSVFSAASASEYFEFDILIIFLLASSVFGAIALLAMLGLQQHAMAKSTSQLSFIIKLIGMQTLCYLLIFTVLSSYFEKTIAISADGFVIGLPYLIIGFVITSFSIKKKRTSATS